ncbi:hypothetical protein [Xanthomonas bromi]|uniref:hypothetical protein n=1 Tax=Xanthomonas bromi TaxID=56449 RepID=UPI001CA5DEF2|nr:hypothetical protein [Xanthomonas bromi]
MLHRYPVNSVAQRVVRATGRSATGAINRLRFFMPTTVKEVPGFKVIANGDNILVQAGNPTQYLVSQIGPYPNSNLIVGNSYDIPDPNHATGIAVELVHAPGGAMQTAIDCDKSTQTLLKPLIYKTSRRITN